MCFGIISGCVLLKGDIQGQKIDSASHFVYSTAGDGDAVLSTNRSPTFDHIPLMRFFLTVTTSPL
jgi:hypothetical protein